MKFGKISRSNWTGVEAHGLVLELPDLIPQGAILDLAWAGAHISPN